MDFKTLLPQSDLAPLARIDLAADLAGVPEQGLGLLRGFSRQSGELLIARMRPDRFDQDLTLNSSSDVSGPWYSGRGIGVLYWPGDLSIDGDLLDDDYTSLPILVVQGNLTLRHWLRGGMSAFVGGSVHASGYVVGHYNDSALFVGGDLRAEGYLPCAKPQSSMPDVAPHQIAGRIDARTLDLHGITDEALRSHLVDEVLGTDDDNPDEVFLYLDERAVMSRSNAGLPIWR
ncbi:MAG: hypothetical protein KDJ14_03430 [Xanthomonadales bacterium]|nr:hypothetical protein [Xanthomonadales bacterium]